MVPMQVQQQTHCCSATLSQPGGWTGTTSSQSGVTNMAVCCGGATWTSM